jgi:hypothetical protein
MVHWPHHPWDHPLHLSPLPCTSSCTQSPTSCSGITSSSKPWHQHFHVIQVGTEQLVYQSDTGTAISLGHDLFSLTTTTNDFQQSAISIYSCIGPLYPLKWSGTQVNTCEWCITEARFFILTKFYLKSIEFSFFLFQNANFHGFYRKPYHLFLVTWPWKSKTGYRFSKAATPDFPWCL